MTLQTNTIIDRKFLRKSLVLNLVPEKDIDEILTTPGRLKSWLDVKFLLDSNQSLQELDKQCIINTCYRLMKINLLF
jgi:hypothetical protein